MLRFPRALLLSSPLSPLILTPQLRLRRFKGGPFLLQDQHGMPRTAVSPQTLFSRLPGMVRVALSWADGDGQVEELGSLLARPCGLQTAGPRSGEPGTRKSPAGNGQVPS